MSRVADNQERAVEMRRAYVYRQSVLIRFHRGNGKLAREESRDYTVTPTAEGTQKLLVQFTGKYADGAGMVEYSKPHYTYKEIDLDGEIISELADDLVNESHSRDGIACDLFPLTSERQRNYTFRLEGRENYRGADVYRITFRPSARPKTGDGAPWAGEVLVDVNEFQPVLITTRLAKGVPLWVQTVLGTNVRRVGFKVAYKKFADGVWFPVSYGGEFELRAVFFYKRKISISLVNAGFERAEVESRVQYAGPI